MVSIPHGGHLINRVARDKRRERLLEEASSLPKIELNSSQVLKEENRVKTNMENIGLVSLMMYGIFLQFLH